MNLQSKPTFTLEPIYTNLAQALYLEFRISFAEHNYFALNLIVRVSYAYHTPKSMEGPNQKNNIII